jgi:iron(III) transport system ATP-binding protein
MTGHQPPTPAIHCHLLTKHFGDTVALDDFELEIGRGEILSLLGPSGCGKTTALRVIAGFENPESGTVTIADATVVGEGVMLAPDKRRVGMVFQDYALFPHMTVAANIAYGLSGPGRHERVADVIAMVGLTGMGATGSTRPGPSAGTSRDPPGRALLESRRNDARPHAAGSALDPQGCRCNGRVRHPRP